MSHPESHSSAPTGIRLIPEAAAPHAPEGATFRYSRSRAALTAALLVGCSAALVTVARTQRNPFAYYIAALLLMFLWIYRSMLFARFRPTNWLVRITDDGAYIKYRSYLNHHFCERDPTVIHVPFRDMRLARLVRELQQVPDSDGRGTTARPRTLVEIELKSEAPEIERALKTERDAEAPKVPHWYGTSKAKYVHHPVQMPAPRVIAVEWSVVPDAPSFLAVMAVHVPVETSSVVRDYTGLAGLEQHEQETRLLELTDAGQLIDAIRLARSLYGYDITEAKSFVEGLSEKAKA